MTQTVLPRKEQYISGPLEMQPQALRYDPALLEQRLKQEQATYDQGTARLFDGWLLGDQEALELRLLLPVLKGRIQMLAELLGLPDPTPPIGRL